MNKFINITIISILFLHFNPNTINAQEPTNEKPDSLNLVCHANIEDLPISEGNMIALPRKGLFIEDGATFYSLDSVRCPQIKKFRFKENFAFEQCVVSGENLLVKSHEFVMRIHNSGTSIAAELDTETFFIHGGTGSIYHIVVLESDNTWGWYTCNYENGNMKCIIRTSHPINHIFGDEENALCAIGSCIYTVTDNGFVLIGEFPDFITDALMTTKGLLLCTNSTLYFLDYNTYEPTPLLSGRFHSIHYDGEVLYIVLHDGRILKGFI